MNPHLADLTPAEIRELCREGSFDRPTAGVAMGFVQANLVVLPQSMASDFEAFCRLNPKPCPLLEITEPGCFEPSGVAPGADLRTDLPRYRIFRSGEFVSSTNQVIDEWRADFVSFLIGCSFTFEAALLAEGLPVRHIERDCNVPMYRTNLPCKPAGPFAGPLVVSMRPMTREQAERAARICDQFQNAHGEPIHVGNPALIGIADIAEPDFGDCVDIGENEVPMFWACGVTPIGAVLEAAPAIALTHEPGHMFVTDLRDEDLRRAE